MFQNNTRIIRHLCRRGILDKNGSMVKTPVLDDDLDHLEVLTKSMQEETFLSLSSILTKIGKGFGYMEERPQPQKRMTVTLNGFSLHAGTVVNSNSREELFKLLEYQCRPPISDSRLEVLEFVDKSLVSSTRWCEFISKTFKVDVGSCPFCKSPMRIVSFIFDGREIFRYLNHTDRIRRVPP